MKTFDWQTILSLKETVSFESLGVLAGQDSFGVIDLGNNIYTHSRLSHSSKGVDYTHIYGFIWAENLSNARRIVSRVPVPVVRSGGLPPDVLKPYDCDWSYEEMFQSARQDSKSRMSFFNWLPETKTLEMMLNVKEGFSQLRYQDRVDLDDKTIQIEGIFLYYSRADLSAPYAVLYDILNWWDGG